MIWQARRSERPLMAFRCATASRLAAGPTINGVVRLVLLPNHEAVTPKEVAMRQRNVPRAAAVYGIDIGKNIFHVISLRSDRASPEGAFPTGYAAPVLRAGSVGDRGDAIVRRIPVNCQEDTGDQT